MDNALSQVIDHQLEERTPVELAYAYRALCASLLVRTAMIHASKAPRRKDEVENRRAAKEWVASSGGIISFRDACNAVDLDPQRAIDGIRRYAETAGAGAISKSKRPRSHYVFGRINRNARNPKHPTAD